jgi:hypothetical protein
MSQHNIYKIITVIAGCSLALVTWQSVNANVPEPWAPFSIFHVILGLASGSGILVFSWATAAFWVWNPGAFNGKSDVPKRSIVLYGILAALSILHNVVGISYGLRYQGKVYTVIVTSVNFALILIIASLLIHSRRAPSFAKSLFFHWLLFAWLLSYAFPYLGELI